MKKGLAFLFMGIAFIVGIVLGVVLTVLYEERGGSPMLPPAAGPSSTAISKEIGEQVRSLQAILKNDPQNRKALIDLGNVYFDAEQFEPAIEMYSRALEIEPKDADVRTDRGIMYRRKGEIERAIADFRKAAGDNPQHVNSRYNLGVVLLHDKGDMKGAILAWEDYLKVDPGSPRAENIRIQISKMKTMVK
jgi:tetratricopeptide (TPR) repeat protein